MGISTRILALVAGGVAVLVTAAAVVLLLPGDGAPVKPAQARSPLQQFGASADPAIIARVKGCADFTHKISA